MPFVAALRKPRSNLALKKNERLSVMRRDDSFTIDGNIGRCMRVCF